MLRLEKFPMVFCPGESENSAFCLPLVKSESGGGNNSPPGKRLAIDWKFLRRIRDESAAPRLSPLADADRAGFMFNAEDYSDAVVMPWYRNQGCNSIDILGYLPNPILSMFGILRHF